jgi:hypothetical protein
MWGTAFAPLVCVMTAGATRLGYAQAKVASAPEVTDEKDGVKIDFVADKPTDVAVGIPHANEETVRHLPE